MTIEREKFKLIKKLGTLTQEDLIKMLKSRLSLSILLILLLGISFQGNAQEQVKKADSEEDEESAKEEKTPKKGFKALPSFKLAFLDGKHKDYVPLSRFPIRGIRVEFPIQAVWSRYSASQVPVSDSNAIYHPSATSDFQARMGVSIDSRNAFYPIFFKAFYEQDFYALSGGTGNLSNVDGMPSSAGQERNLLWQNQDGINPSQKLVLRKAYGQVSIGPFVTFGGGYMTSQWGLGLLANDGTNIWKSESAYFGDPRGGDRVLRGFLATGPWTKGKLLLTLAFDKVQWDDILLNQDTAQQFVAAAILGYDQPNQLGAYVVSRDQTIPQIGKANKKTQVFVFDVYGKLHRKVFNGMKLDLAFEFAMINGDTTLAPNPEVQKYDVVQMAFASKAKLGGNYAGAVVDFVYASGDQNFDDKKQNAFKIDPNFEMGLVLFRHVLAAQSAYGPVTASDLNIVGKPNEDLDRLPTRRSVSNTVAVFPRFWAKIYHGLEIYGGPLLAWGNVPLADPRNSRFNGGFPVNALGGKNADQFLGTELDIGLRGQFLLNGAEFNAGFEYGVFIPGPAFKNVNGQDLSNLSGGRLILRARF